MSVLVKAILLIGAGCFGSFFFGLYVGRFEGERTVDARCAGDRARLQAEVKRLDGERIELSRRRDRTQIDYCEMFTWYEKCLDGRTCTVAGEELPALELKWACETPKLPERVLPGVKVRDRVPWVTAP